MVQGLGFKAWGFVLAVLWATGLSPFWSHRGTYSKVLLGALNLPLDPKP